MGGTTPEGPSETVPAEPAPRDPDVRDAQPRGPKLPDPDVRDAQPRDSKLPDPDVPDPDVRDAQPRGPKLPDPDVREASSPDPSPPDPKLRSPKLRDPDLRNPDLRDPKLPGAEGGSPASAGSAPSTAATTPGPGSGPARGSLRRGQWFPRSGSAVPAAAVTSSDKGPGGGAKPAAGSGPAAGSSPKVRSGPGAGSGSAGAPRSPQAPAAEPAAEPGAARGRRAGATTAVLAAVTVLLIGLGAAVTVQVHGHGSSGTDKRVDAAATGRIPASQQSVGPALPAATPSTAVTHPAKKTAPGQRPVRPPAPPFRMPPAPLAPHRAPVKVTLPAPLGHWRLGAGGLGRDQTGAYPAVVTHVGLGHGHGGSGIFDGKDSQVATHGQVVATGPGGSFTVSAWAYLGDTRAFHTVVSQDGAHDSGFYLQYSAEENRWAFARVRTDGPPSDLTHYRALSLAPPAVRVWTHLVGVYDAAGRDLTLYVNGVRQNSVRDLYPFGTGGDLVIGRGRWNDAGADWFNGQISDVEVFGQPLSPAQVRALH